MEAPMTPKRHEATSPLLLIPSPLRATSKLRAAASEFVPCAAAHAPGPVVSVRKMGHRGCAIVLLRDEALVDLAERMAVAVVDGVCVELRRHKRDLGVFVAWGHRVERKASVSEEGLTKPLSIEGFRETCHT